MSKIHIQKQQEHTDVVEQLKKKSIDFAPLIINELAPKANVAFFAGK